jgi:phosphoglycolate phosphatase
MKYRLVAFDFDGTVADSFDCFLRVLNLTAQTHGFRTIEPTMFDEMRGMSGDEIRRYLKIPWWKVPRIATALRRRMFERIGEVQLFPGVESLWQSLAQADVTLGIVTSNSFENVSRVMGTENQKLIHHFECNIGLMGKWRPLRRLLKRSGIPASAALYIGDEKRDAEAARGAGWDFIGVTWGYAKPEALQPYSNGKLFHQIEDILTRINGS